MDKLQIEKIIKVLNMIEEDMREDAEHMDGKPFNGRTVAEAFGHQGAAIAALAVMMKRILRDE